VNEIELINTAHADPEARGVCREFKLQIVAAKQAPLTIFKTILFFDDWKVFPEGISRYTCSWGLGAVYFHSNLYKFVLKPLC